jgi:hypothetical protein
MKKLILLLILISALISSCRKTYECRCKEEFEGVVGTYEFSFLIRFDEKNSKEVCEAKNIDGEFSRITCNLLEQ